MKRPLLLSGPWNDDTLCANAFRKHYNAGQYRYGLDAIQQAYAWWEHGWTEGGGKR